MLFPLGSLLLLLLVIAGVWGIIDGWRDRHQDKIDESRLAREERKAKKDEFLGNLHITWYQIVVIFAIGSVAGLIIEEVWMFITAGLTDKRYGLVWGPFSPLYGVGATLFTVLFFAMRKRGAKAWLIFVASMIVGGLLEQITGWALEAVMGATSWDYTNVPGCITKWVAWPFLFMWGALGLAWAKLIMPELLYRIGEPTNRRKVVFVGLLAVYLAFDIFMTLACFDRVGARDRGEAPSNAFEQWVDTNYNDEFVANRFQNMMFS